VKSKVERTRPNSDEAGATPPFDAPCVTVAVGSLPPQSRAARDPFSRVPEPEFRSCKTTFITSRKGERTERHGDHQGTRKKNPRRRPPRFVMGRPSKASWTGMLNSAVILFPPVAPLHCRDGAIRFLKLTSVTAIRPDKRQIALPPPRFI